MPATLTKENLLIDIPLNGNALLKPISCTVNYYDGAAFEGLPFEEIGSHGALVKTETLIITDHQINDAYNNDTPECFKASPDYSSYPNVIKLRN